LDASLQKGKRVVTKHNKTQKSKEQYVRELVKAHSELDEPLTFAAWIKKDNPEVWLVEIVDTMSDSDVLPEITFSPTRDFPFILKLIIGNNGSIRSALKNDEALGNELKRGIDLTKEISRVSE